MNSRFLIMLMIALTLAGGAAWIANRWVESQTLKPEATDQTTVKVYVAAVEIPFATRIAKTHYKLVAWPKESVPAEAFTEADTTLDPSAIDGKVTQREFYPGEILLKPQIKEHVGGSTLSALIQEGMRAISVRVNDVVGVAGFILPGNKADIIHTREHHTYTLLKNIKILAIDQTASTDQDKPAVVQALTLEVTPKQAEILVNAMQTGSLQFALRNPMETTDSLSPGELTGTQTASLKTAPNVRPAPLTVKILPWANQEFISCKEDGSC